MTAILLVLADLFLLAGLTARLTRLVVFDDIGRWWLRVPLERWAIRHDGLGLPDPMRDPDARPPEALTYPDGMGGTGTYTPGWSPQDEWSALYPARVFQRGAAINGQWTEAFTAALALRHDSDRVTDPQGWRSKIVSGLDCPWCVGFWIAGLTLASLVLAGGPGEAHDLWRVVAGWFTLNYVVAHIGPRLGDTG